MPLKDVTSWLATKLEPPPTDIECPHCRSRQPDQKIKVTRLEHRTLFEGQAGFLSAGIPGFHCVMCAHDFVEFETHT